MDEQAMYEFMLHSMEEQVRVNNEIAERKQKEQEAFKNQVQTMQETQDDVVLLLADIIGGVL